MARRSMASTMPGDPSSGSGAWLLDQPSWCVDLGPTLRAMSTCDLWLALAKGDVAPGTKVWREGMAYWEPVARVPEFALALPDASLWSSAPTSVAPVATTTHAGRVEEREAAKFGCETGGSAAGEPAHGADPSAVGVVTLAPPGDFSTPAPVVVEHGEPPPESHARPRWLPRIDRRGAASVVTGAVLAIVMLALATTGPTGSGDPVRAGTQPAAAPALRDVQLGTAPPAIEKLAEEAPPVQEARPTAGAGERHAPMAPGTTVAGSADRSEQRAPAAQPPKHRAPRGPHAADRGQRRSRAGTR